eukprot:6169900-Alexandrium_andersonii.AAC.1
MVVVVVVGSCGGVLEVAVEVERCVEGSTAGVVVGSGGAWWWLSGHVGLRYVGGGVASCSGMAMWSR